MKKLKVTWQDGSWNPDGEQPIATADVHVQARIFVVGETLVFQDPKVAETILVIPSARLISARQVEVEA